MAETPNKPKRSRWLMWLIICALALVAVWLVPCLVFAWKQTRRPQPRFDEPAPEVAWGKVESLRLTTADGQDLGAWFVPGPEDGPSVLLLHGHGHSRQQSLPAAEVFAADGCSVLMISFRAHGDSSGDYNDIGWGAQHDALAAVEWLEKKRPGKPIIVRGLSLGAAAAVLAARQLGPRVRGYILECPYQDLKTAVRNRTELWLPPVLDRVGFAGMMAAAVIFLPHLDETSPVERIGDIPESIPILILAGEADQQARPFEARALHERVSSHCRLVFIDKAGHGPLVDADPELYRREVRHLIRDSVGSNP